MLALVGRDLTGPEVGGSPKGQGLSDTPPTQYQPFGSIIIISAPRRRRARGSPRPSLRAPRPHNGRYRAETSRRAWPLRPGVDAPLPRHRGRSGTNPPPLRRKVHRGSRDPPLLQGT